MKQSLLFTKTRKESPKDEVAKNADLLIRAGYIHKELAGVYSLLPLGLRVMNNIANIIREEMNAVGGQELFLTVLQDKSPWEKTGRWSDAVVDNWFKTKLKNDTEVGLASTHEEPLTALMKNHIRSFRDLPVYTYQIQTKFRNEARAKSGIMRGREFLMKDLYSFSRDQKDHDAFYEKAKIAYMNVFRRVGLGNKTYITFASGGTFSKYSHEFQTITDAGEDIIYIHEGKKIAVNKEVMNDEVLADLGVKKEDLKEAKAVEVGNIFSLGYRFSEPLELTYLDELGKPQKVFMGCYGIGLGRLMGVVAETFSDVNGLVWPKEIAPFAVHLVELGGEKPEVRECAEKLYAEFNKKGISVLYDNRDLRAGEKFKDSDLIGIPLRVVVSEKMLAEQSVEVKDRKTGEVAKVPLDAIVSYVRAL
ncbi:MAG: aminoacyl--tRNA ligase-related protein [Candidatus Paceibacterota bacterium]|jgi:prolyl-tRNA synthetase